jgi:two-component system response regulator FixJ
VHHQACIHVVDDDAAVRASLRLLLESCGLQVADYASAEAFLADGAFDQPGCIVSDIQMPGLSGLELQDTLEQRGIHLPIIMLTGHADVSSAVRSLKAGAMDFIEKPFAPQQLVDQVHAAIALDARRHAALAKQTRMDKLLATLTPREREVLDCVAAGHSNKVVAADLRISERTVELHRGRGLKKLNVRTVAELVRLMLNQSHHQPSVFK